MCGIGLQLLQPDRRFEFARLQLKSRAVAVIQIGVHDLHRAAAEIRREVVIKIAEHRAGENRPRTAQQKTVVAVDAAVVEKRPAVQLHQRRE